jgi:hypothetical protein
VGYSATARIGALVPLTMRSPREVRPFDQGESGSRGVGGSGPAGHARGESDEAATAGSPARGVTDLLFSPRQAFAEFFQGGTSWIGPSQGLDGSPAHRQGHRRPRRRRLGVNFSWGS